MIAIDESKKLANIKPLKVPGVHKVISLYEIRTKDNVLIWTDDQKDSIAPQIAKVFYDVLKSSHCNVSIIVEKSKKEMGPASAKTQEAILSLGMNDVFISIGSANRGYVEVVGEDKKKSHALMKDLMKKNGFKMVSIGGLASIKKAKVNAFIESFDCDISDVKKTDKKLYDLMQKTGFVKITCPAGTDLLLELDTNREVVRNEGNWKDYSTNYPVGEVYAAPNEGSANGVAYVSSAKLSGETILPKKPIKFVFDNGKLVSTSDASVNKNLEYSEEFNKKNNISNPRDAVRTIAEFAIGTNKKATIVGAMICDEKAYGTCHFAIGNNKHLGGNNYCHGHFDNVIVNPTIWFDGKMIMEKGKLLI